MKIRKESSLYPHRREYDYTDSYEFVIRDGKQKIGIPEIVESFVEPGPRWVGLLFALRNKIAALFQLKTSLPPRTDEGEGDKKWEAGMRAGIFKIFERTPAEIILGDDDIHLDVRISLFLEKNGEHRFEKRVTVTTVVKIHNALGKGYFFFVKPVHRIIVPLLLKQKFNRLQSDVEIQPECRG